MFPRAVDGTVLRTTGADPGRGVLQEFLRKQISEIKACLNSPDLPWGIDLLLPQVGGSARKTNYDYTKGELPELIDIIIEGEKKARTSCIPCAVSVLPRDHGVFSFVFCEQRAPRSSSPLSVSRRASPWTSCTPPASRCERTHERLQSPHPRVAVLLMCLRAVLRS